MTHNLKTWPGNFDAIASGRKKHEVRKADRDFSPDDTVIFQEWNLAVYEQELNARLYATGSRNVEPATKQAFAEEAKAKAYTGRTLMRKITYVTLPGSWGLPNDICVFSIE